MHEVGDHEEGEASMLHPGRSIVAAGFLLLSGGIAVAAPGVTKANLKLRSGPGQAFAVLTTMPANSPLNVLGCAPDGWCRVTFGAFTGYANGGYLNMAGAPVVAVPGPVVVPAPVVVPGRIIVRRPYRRWRHRYRRYRYRFR